MTPTPPLCTFEAVYDGWSHLAEVIQILKMLSLLTSFAVTVKYC